MTKSTKKSKRQKETNQNKDIKLRNKLLSNFKESIDKAYKLVPTLIANLIIWSELLTAWYMYFVEHSMQQYRFYPITLLVLSISAAIVLWSEIVIYQFLKKTTDQEIKQLSVNPISKEYFLEVVKLINIGCISSAIIGLLILFIFHTRLNILTVLLFGFIFILVTLKSCIRNIYIYKIQKQNK
mgnify:CR=1 FL=1